MAWKYFFCKFAFNNKRWYNLSMKKFFAKKQGDNFILEGDELTHFNVLRCKVDEEVLVLGTDGFDYLCRVETITKKQATLSVISKSQNTKNPKIDITLFQGLVKGEKLDLIVQKLTELGITNLYTFESEFTIAKSNNNKIERLSRVSQEACKQCGRSLPLNINESISFKDMLEKLKEYDIVLFANEKDRMRNMSSLKAYKKIAIIVGSEGGFSDNEIEQIIGVGAVNFGLGERILRAETAAIATSAIVAYMADV